MSLVQITKRTGRVDRVKRGETPVLELQLGDHERIVTIELVEAHQFLSDLERKTVDWRWTAYVESRL